MVTVDWYREVYRP